VPAESVGLRPLPRDTAVFLDQVEPVGGDEQAVAARELEHHEIAVEAAALGAAQAHVLGHTVIHMDHVVADLEIAEIGQEHLAPATLGFGPAFDLAEQVAFGEHDQPGLRQLEAVAQQRDLDGHPRHGEVVLVEDLAQPFDAALGAHDADDALALVEPAAHVGGHLGHPAGVAARLTARDVEFGLGLLRRIAGQFLQEHPRGGEFFSNRPSVAVELGGRWEDTVLRLLVRHAQVVIRAHELLVGAVGLVDDGDEVACVGEQVARTLTGQPRQGLETGPVTLLLETFEQLTERADRVAVADRLPRGVLEEAGDASYRIVGRRILRARGDDDPVELAGRALVVGVEGADRVHGIAEQLDPDRLVGGRREHVHDAPAPGDLTGCAHDVHAAVTELDRVEHELVGGQRVVLADRT